MFTGLIEGLGKVETIKNKNLELEITIAPEFEISDYQIGESIAVNGACLTVEKYKNNLFSCYASKETIEKTSLKSLKTNNFVNLERALRLGDRLGGHLVSGHIDGIGTIKEIKKVGSSIRYEIEIPKNLEKYVIEKGSVALDGISLTINDCKENIINVNIIPKTQETTNIKYWNKGSLINIETDIIGKYIYKNIDVNNRQKKSNITPDFLSKNGFF